MNIRNLTGMLFLIVIVACSPDTLQSTYEKQKKESGVDGFNIIHIEENDEYGLVVETSWTEQYIENKDKPGIMVYEKYDGEWVTSPGMQCQDLPGALGIGGGRYLFCASITENQPYVKIMVGETEAQIFNVKWGSYATGEPEKIR